MSTCTQTYKLKGIGLEGISLELNLAPRCLLTLCVFWCVISLGVQHPLPLSYVCTGGTGVILRDCAYADSCVDTGTQRHKT